MSIFKRLSYNISAKLTANGSETESSILIIPVERLNNGDRANSSRVVLFNHCGTHIDFPHHSFHDGRSIVEFSIEELIFDRPFIIDIPLTDNELVIVEHLHGKQKKLSECDLLLIRSGFSVFRASDLDRYTWNTPGVTAEAAQYLVDNFPNIRAIGIDFLSFETLRDISHGFRAHKAVLGKDVIIIEDLNLAEIDNGIISRIFAFPLYIEDIDSFHTTVVAELIS
jgi:kynurenine formamidase